MHNKIIIIIIILTVSERMEEKRDPSSYRAILLRVFSNTLRS